MDKQEMDRRFRLVHGYLYLFLSLAILTISIPTGAWFGVLKPSHVSIDTWFQISTAFAVVVCYCLEQIVKKLKSLLFLRGFGDTSFDIEKKKYLPYFFTTRALAHVFTISALLLVPFSILYSDING